MRIIAGEHRGRRLLSPAGDQTRPVTDRVKQSIFDIVAPFLEGARVYDVFAGTGSFGLEAISRGAAHATFFEMHKPTVALLKQNISALKADKRSMIVTSDCFTYFAQASTTPMSASYNPRADVIFLDPPYRYLVEQPDALRRAAQHLADHHLSPDGFVVFRHDAADRLTLPALPAYDTRDYGSMTVELLRKPRTEP